LWGIYNDSALTTTQRSLEGSTCEQLSPGEVASKVEELAEGERELLQFTVESRAYLQQVDLVMEMINGPFDFSKPIEDYRRRRKGGWKGPGLCDMIQQAARTMRTVDARFTTGKAIVQVFKNNPTTSLLVRVAGKLIEDKLRGDESGKLEQLEEYCVAGGYPTGTLKTKYGESAEGQVCREDQGAISGVGGAVGGVLGKMGFSEPQNCAVGAAGTTNRRKMHTAMNWMEKFLLLLGARSQYYAGELRRIDDCLGESRACRSRASEQLAAFFSIDQQRLSGGAHLDSAKALLKTFANSMTSFGTAIHTAGAQLQAVVDQLEALSEAVEPLFQPLEALLDHNMAQYLVWPSTSTPCLAANNVQFPKWNGNFPSTSTLTNMCTLPQVSCNLCSPSAPTCNAWNSCNDPACNGGGCDLKSNGGCEHPSTIYNQYFTTTQLKDLLPKSLPCGQRMISGTITLGDVIDGINSLLPECIPLCTSVIPGITCNVGSVTMPQCNPPKFTGGGCSSGSLGGTSCDKYLCNNACDRYCSGGYCKGDVYYGERYNNCDQVCQDASCKITSPTLPECGLPTPVMPYCDNFNDNIRAPECSERPGAQQCLVPGMNQICPGPFVAELLDPIITELINALGLDAALEALALPSFNFLPELPDLFNLYPDIDWSEYVPDNFIPDVNGLPSDINAYMPSTQLAEHIPNTEQLISSLRTMHSIATLIIANANGEYVQGLPPDVVQEGTNLLNVDAASLAVEFMDESERRRLGGVKMGCTSFCGGISFVSHKHTDESCIQCSCQNFLDAARDKPTANLSPRPAFLRIDLSERLAIDIGALADHYLEIPSKGYGCVSEAMCPTAPTVPTPYPTAAPTDHSCAVDTCTACSAATDVCCNAFLARKQSLCNDCIQVRCSEAPTATPTFMPTSTPTSAPTTAPTDEPSVTPTDGNTPTGIKYAVTATATLTGFTSVEKRSQ
jgi:hypothetical protein